MYFTLRLLLADRIVIKVTRGIAVKIAPGRRHAQRVKTTSDANLGARGALDGPTCRRERFSAFQSANIRRLTLCFGQSVKFASACCSSSK